MYIILNLSTKYKDIALPCIIAELSFRKNLCKYLGIKACRQAKANAEKIHKTFFNAFFLWQIKQDAIHFLKINHIRTTFFFTQKKIM